MIKKYALPILSITLLSGCILDDDKETSINCDPVADFLPEIPVEKQNCALNYDMAIQTVASDYSSSSISMVCSNEEDIINGYAPNSSDFSVSAGDKLYHLGRDKHHTVTQYDFSSPDSANWTCSSNDIGEASSNPYKIIEISDTKAYVIRYDQTKVWIIDPSAKFASEYKTGEIDLSHYAASTGDFTSTSLDMNDGVIVGGYLYISMQRLRDGGSSEYGPTRNYANKSKVAIIDIATDLEVDSTPNNQTDEKAVTLQSSNVQSLSVFNGAIYAASRGDYGTQYGALEVIDTNDHTVSTLVSGSVDQGHILDVTAIDTNSIYFTADFSGYVGEVYQSNQALYKFNGSQIETIINKSEAKEIAEIEKDDNNKLWVAISDASNPGVHRYNTTTDVSDLFLATELNPKKIVFRQ